MVGFSSLLISSFSFSSSFSSTTISVEFESKMKVVLGDIGMEGVNIKVVSFVLLVDKVSFSSPANASNNSKASPASTVSLLWPPLAILTELAPPPPP